MAITAGIIIVGDEILSGKVQDCNSLFMAKELRSYGVNVRHISIISDDIIEISDEVRKLSNKYDYVFTSGGVGPTHDDVTIEGISKAFNVKPVVNDYLKDILQRRYGKKLSPEQLKMAFIPEGAKLIKEELLKFPLVLFKNVYIFPGLPEYLKNKFVALKNIFNEPPILLKKVYIKEYEHEVAPLLNSIVNKYEEVKIGSYPTVNSKDYSVMITLESLDENDLNSALEMFLNGVAKDKVFKIEGLY